MVVRRRHDPRVYRSGLEEKVQAICNDRKLKAEYEVDVLRYTTPPEEHRYTPDFKIRKNTYIETKGRFVAADRKKLLLVKAQHPEVKIYLLFYRDQTISKKSTTYYSDWCNKNGFEWAVFKDQDTWLQWFNTK